jgi:hypothetical protein
MAISVYDLCRLAGDLAMEHGIQARDYARSAYYTLEAEGDLERADFWFTLSVLVDDIVAKRLDPDHIPTLQ